MWYRAEFGSIANLPSVRQACPQKLEIKNVMRLAGHFRIRIPDQSRDPWYSCVPKVVLRAQACWYMVVVTVTCHVESTVLVRFEMYSALN